MKNPLEHFTPLLDAELMAVRLQHHLPECAAGEWQITSCTIQHPRYKTYFSAENRDRAFLSLVYHLRGKHPVSLTAGNRILYARAYLGDHSRQAFAMVQGFVNPHTGGQAIHLAELDMVGWCFPDDPALPWLAELVDLKQAPSLIPRHNSKGGELREIEIINYRPEIRCTVRYGFRSVDALETSLYGKIYGDQHGQTIYVNLLAVSAQSQHADAFVIPTILGYDVGRHSLWLQGLEGVPLKIALFAANPQLLISELSKALAAFHRVSLPQLPLITLEQNLREWHKKAQKLAHNYVDIADSLQSLLLDLESNCPESGEEGLIHGDFHIEQLALLASGRIALFDFDELALGDPLQDLANFSADLYNHKLPTDDTGRLIEKLFTAYRLATQGRADANRFYWHLRGQLLTRAYRAHIQQRPDTARQVARFIALAQRAESQTF